MQVNNPSTLGEKRARHYLSDSSITPATAPDCTHFLHPLAPESKYHHHDWAQVAVIGNCNTVVMERTAECWGAHSKLPSRQASAVISGWCVWKTAPVPGRRWCRRLWIQNAVASGLPCPLITLPSCSAQYSVS